MPSSPDRDQTGLGGAGGVDGAWTTPAPIGASWAANGAFSPVIMCLFCMMLSALIYLPFVKAWERSLLRREQEAQAQQAAAAPGAGLQTP